MTEKSTKTQPKLKLNIDVPSEKNKLMAIKKLVCQSCSQIFTDYKAFEGHFYGNFSRKPKCLKSQEDKILKAQKNSTENSYKCKICQKATFKSKQYLKRHVKGGLFSKRFLK